MHWFDKPILGGSKSGIRNFPDTALANEKGIPSLPAKINHEKNNNYICIFWVLLHIFGSTLTFPKIKNRIHRLREFLVHKFYATNPKNE